MACGRDLTIVVESHVPYVAEALQPYAAVRRVPPQDIDGAMVADADALVVRTRTRCDAALLSGSRCSLVVTATIGTDHIDKAYCAAHSIAVASAPGCNAPAVAQYVFASLARIVERQLAGLTIGVVGVGAVGSIVARWAERLGMRVLLCDPPRCRAEGHGARRWASLGEVLADADVITLHTPLTTDGCDATYHLIDGAAVAAMRRKPIIINAARGAVVDTDAIVAGLGDGSIGSAVIDCWEGEPRISAALLARAAIATPHIAGYSIQGKMRASQVALDALSEHFGLPRMTIDADTTLLHSTPQSITIEQARASYDPMADTEALRRDPSAFERLRNNYALRLEI
ncbi:MAG: 4-phosphoerythronate dehydrogenase [Muribaculaceae bacterium]